MKIEEDIKLDKATEDEIISLRKEISEKELLRLKLSQELSDINNDIDALNLKIINLYKKRDGKYISTKDSLPRRFLKIDVIFETGEKSSGYYDDFDFVPYRDPYQSSKKIVDKWRYSEGVLPYDIMELSNPLRNKPRY